MCRYGGLGAVSVWGAVNASCNIGSCGPKIIGATHGQPNVLDPQGAAHARGPLQLHR